MQSRPVGIDPREPKGWVEMAHDSLSSGRLGRGFAIAIVLVMALSLGLVLTAPARGNFTGAGVVLEPGLYTGTNIYVPGETMTVTAYATVGDSIDFQFWNPVAGSPTSTVAGQVVPATGAKEVTFTIPDTWADGTNYQVHVTDTTSGQVQNRAFSILKYSFTVFTTRNGYLPGDTVNVSWSATLIKDGSPAPDGVGFIQIYDGATNVLPPPGNRTFTKSQYSFTFTLDTTLPVHTVATVFAYFNDSATSPLRQYADTWDFGVGSLRETVSTDALLYQPGGIVTVTVNTYAQMGGAPSGNDPPEPAVNVNITVTDLNSATDVAAYGKSNLTTDARGRLVHVFQLATTPTTGTYQVNAQASTPNGLFSEYRSATPFSVAQTTTITASMVLNKGQYLSGDTITATVSASPAGTYVYSWVVRDTTQAPSITLAVSSGTTTSYSYTTAPTFRGTIQFTVVADDGQGHTSALITQSAAVDYGYLALSLDRSEFNPGETVTASYNLIHGAAVLTNPTYFYRVVDFNANLVASGSASGGTVSYATPNPASRSYTFYITASQDGRTVTGQATTSQASGFLISVSLDKSSYMPGDTIRVSYEIRARGTAVLPLQFRVAAQLLFVATSSTYATSPVGTVSLVLPQGTSSGDTILLVADAVTGASVYQIVHVGAVNPLLADLGGLPVIDWLLMLLVIVLILVVVLLWRRVGMGPGPRVASESKAPTPPPPPGGSQGPQASGPMSVTCKHCGKPIEITTSKRPIEVMCPSCGETQVVQ